MNKKNETQLKKENKYRRDIPRKKPAREKKNPAFHQRWLEVKKARNQKNLLLRKRNNFYQQMSQLSPQELVEIRQTEEMLRDFYKARIKY